LLEYNAAAARFLAQDKQLVLGRRGGDVLHCLHAVREARGCGHAPACADCIVRKAVRSALKDFPITRACTQLERVVGGCPSIVDLRITARAFSFESHTLVLLMLEGLND
jgi:hypothetical protein